MCIRDRAQIVDTYSNGSLKSFIWSMVGGYSVVAGPAANVDLIAGFRYLKLDASVDWNLNAALTGPNGNTVLLPRSGSVGKSQSVTAGIVGAKGRVKLCLLYTSPLRSGRFDGAR